MSKKQMIRRRGLCGLLAVAMCIGVLPPTAGAAVTAKNEAARNYLMEELTVIIRKILRICISIGCKK